jgi:hypothetical protein
MTMPIPALLAPLLSQGLSLIGNAVMAKGKDWVEDKTGVKLDGPLSDADATKLRQYEMDHEEELLRLRIEEKKLGIDELTVMLKAAANEDNNVSDRWKADMTSDSWLSKNVRPGTLVYLLTAYLIFALLDGAGYKISESYVSLLGQWGMLVMTAYFGGRTVEKVMEMRKGSKE